MPTVPTWLGMDAILAVGAAMLLALTAYVVLAGADFGGGIWDLLARGPRRHEQQQAIAHAIGPVWEANHVWLIFLLVILFTAFPTAYAALSVALFAPFHLVLAGIVLRGAAFVFRAANPEAGSRSWQVWARLFGIASVITPFILGATLTAVSSGGIRVRGEGVTVTLQTWFSPVSLVTGTLTLALCAYLAAVYLTVETRGELREDFRIRALGAGAVVLVLPALLLPLVWWQSPLLWEHLSQPTSLPPMAAGLLCAGGSMWALWHRRYAVARILAVAEVIILLWGWAFAQWPYIIYPDVTAYNSAGPAPSIRFLLNTLPFGLALLLPSLWLLFHVFKAGRPPQRP